MKRNILYWIFGLAVLTSCNKGGENDYPVDPVQGLGKNEMVETEMELLVSVDNVFNHGFNDNDCIGLFIKNCSEENDTLNSNIKAYYARGEWKMSTGVMAGKENMEAYAYFPYSSIADIRKVPVEGNTDVSYLYGKSKYFFNASYNRIDVFMKPALSLLRFNIRKQNMPDERVLESISIKGKEKDLPVAGVIDLITGKIANTSFGEYGKDNIGIVLDNEYDDDSYTSMVVMPMLITTKGGKSEATPVSIILSISGRQYSLVLPEEANYWEQGKISDINIIFNGEEIHVESISIKEWTLEEIPLVIQ